ncbi:hypothetical protein ACNFU2_17665 [Chryseobacterium sp. PTM-20240506]|uniref:hypothetical protein n=1 Tax=Chryseobacterium sp. PTM-20240506 TaxID=3400631 RepID=UPI003AB00FBC
MENIKTEEAKVIQNNIGTATNFAYIINVSDQLAVELKEHISTLKEIIKSQKEEIERLRKELNSHKE